jgi:hypothetical protein
METATALTPGAVASSSSNQAASAPAAEVVSQPYAIPAGMTADGAQARIKELLADKEFGARFINGSADSREHREMDALNRHALGMEPGSATEAPPVEQSARPVPPIDETEYKMPPLIPLDDTDEARAQFGEARSMALAHGLSSGEFTTIAEQQAADLQRFQGMTTEEIQAKLDAEMQRIWRDDYDGHVERVERYLADHRGLREKLVGLGLGHNKAALMILGQLAAVRYGLGGSAGGR